MLIENMGVSNGAAKKSLGAQITPAKGSSFKGESERNLRTHQVVQRI